MKERRQYSDERKAAAVKMVTRDGMIHTEVTRKLGIPKGSIGNWVAVVKEGKPPAWPEAASLTEVRAENVKLHKELALSNMETEIPKYARHIHGPRILRQGVAPRYAVMNQLRLQYPVEVLTRTIGISRSGF